MTQNIKFCSVLWIIVAIIAAHTVAAMKTPPPTTETTTGTLATTQTTAAPVITTTTTTAAPDTTTAAPGTTAAPVTTTAVPDPCASNPCGKGSTCEARATQGFVCLCLAGDMYNYITGSCVKAKVFPAHLNLPNIPYENNMSDKASPAFKRTADLITQELDKSLGSDPTYIRSIVLELRPADNSLFRMLVATNATIEIIYSPESNITASDVVAEVEKATECTSCLLAGGTFTDEDLCERNPCDVNSTRCSSKDGTFNCTCLDGYVPTDLSTRVCHMVAPGNTTAAPGNTTAAPGTTTLAPGTTTVAPGTTTAAPDSCASNPCGKGSTCEARANKGFVCLCLAGDNYNNKTHRCDPAKVFPGQIQLPDIPYENSMSDKASPAFKRTADLITQELDKSLGSDPTYVRSIVLELRPAANSQLRMSPGIDATVEIMYSPESDITASDVVAEVQKATNCTNCSLAGGTFTEENLCKRNACDEVTASCFSGDGTFTCTCRNEYVPNDFSTRACRACPSGQKAVDSVCINCPFGYSGFNCNESTVLILVIVGSVLGGLLLISLILLIAVLSKKSSQKNKQAVTGTPPAAFANARMDRNLSLDDQEYEIMPYAQSQLQKNPYGRSQGHTNHYYN